MSELSTPSAHLAVRPILVVAAAGGVLLAGTIALWAQYGTAMFYEMIVAGLTACM